MVKPTTIRLLLSLAVSRSWTIRQIDIQNAFLYGLLHEDVYMKQPPSFVDSSHPDHLCKLDKSLYGLKRVLGSLGSVQNYWHSVLWLLRLMPPYLSSTKWVFKYTCLFMLMISSSSAHPPLSSTTSCSSFVMILWSKTLAC
jgi:hypothetical protein